jgi:hypothetical protein
LFFRFFLAFIVDRRPAAASTLTLGINMDGLNHWRYFLSIEREFTECLRYVEFTDEQRDVYSFEFARLLLLSCAELDVVLKVICSHIDSTSSADSIGQYFSCIDTKYNVPLEEVRVNRFSLALRPFEDWTRDVPPAWWTAHNKVKHRRHESFHLASAINSLEAISGLFVANLVLLSETSLIDSVGERPVLLGREHAPGYLMLEGGYQVRTR